MLPPPRAHPIHGDLTAEVARVLPAPFPLARLGAGRPAFRRRTVPL